MPPPSDPLQVQLADILAMLRRRQRIAVAAALAAVLLLFIFPVFSMSSMYRAEATLTMGRGLKPVQFQYDPIAGQVPEQLVNTQRELILSKGVLDAAITMGALLTNPAYANSADPTALLQRRLQAQVIRSSWVIVVSLEDEDPLRAERGLRSVLDAYLAHQATQARNRTAQDAEFLQGQLAETTQNLQKTKNAERVYRSEHSIASTDPDSNHITVRIRSLAERQAALDDRHAAAMSLVKQMRTADGLPQGDRMAAYTRVDNVSTISLVGSLQKTLFECQAEEAELAQRYLDKHPRLIEVRSRMAAITAQLDDTLRATRGAAESDLQMLTEQRAALGRAQEQLQQDLNTYREHLIGLQRLALETAAQQKVADELQAKLAQLAASGGYDENRMIIDGPPRSSPIPGRMGSTALLFLVALTALAAGLGAAAIADRIDPTVCDAAQFRQATGLRQLGRLPWCSRISNLVSTGPTEPEALAEAVRSLANALRLVLADRQGCQVILVTSPCPGDGRSTVVARLAAGCGGIGLRVLVIDSDLRLPSQHRQFGVEQAPGLAHLLSGQPNLAPLRSPLPNIDVMPAGEAPANAGELLHSHCLPEWLGQVRPHYNLIILDAPPLSVCGDAPMLASHADAILLLARAGSSTRTALADGWESLASYHGKVCGSVLVLDPRHV